MTPRVAIVGAGPAGMSAAKVLADAGASVVVVDEQESPGGQVYRAVDRVRDNFPESLAALGEDYARGAALTGTLGHENITLRPGTAVWDIAGGESPRLGIVDSGGAATIHPDHVILATGAMERPMPFPGWTQPGVMGVGAAQTLLKSSGLLPTGRVVLAGTGPLVYLFARQMLAAGGQPAAILDTAGALPAASQWPSLFRAMLADSTAMMKGLRWVRDIRRAGISHVRGVRRIAAEGVGRIESVVCENAGGASRRLACDLLLVHDGVIPNTHVSMAAGCRHHWNKLQKHWAPEVDEWGRSSVEGISICGDQAGILGADAAEVSGRLTGMDVAGRLQLEIGGGCVAGVAADRKRLDAVGTSRRFLDAHFLPLEACQVPRDDDTLVCRCEQVTAGEIRRVAAHGCMGPNQGKAFTRCGMGPCMGRYCGNTVSQLLADCHQRSVEEIGHYRIRPPLRPLTVGELARLDDDARL